MQRTHRNPTLFGTSGDDVLGGRRWLHRRLAWERRLAALERADTRPDDVTSRRSRDAGAA
jgi:hypothetical protein